jgi:hypothetical protein
MTGTEMQCIGCIRFNLPFSEYLSRGLPMRRAEAKSGGFGERKLWAESSPHAHQQDQESAGTASGFRHNAHETAGRRAGRWPRQREPCARLRKVRRRLRVGDRTIHFHFTARRVCAFFSAFLRALLLSVALALGCSISDAHYSLPTPPNPRPPLPPSQCPSPSPSLYRGAVPFPAIKEGAEVRAADSVPVCVVFPDAGRAAQPPALPEPRAVPVDQFRGTAERLSVQK